MGTNLGIKEKIGAENGFTKACSGFRLPGHKLGQKVEILKPRRSILRFWETNKVYTKGCKGVYPKNPKVHPKTLGAEGDFYKGLFRVLNDGA